MALRAAYDFNQQWLLQFHPAAHVEWLLVVYIAQEKHYYADELRGDFTVFVQGAFSLLPLDWPGTRYRKAKDRQAKINQVVDGMSMPVNTVIELVHISLAPCVDVHQTHTACVHGIQSQASRNFEA